MKKDAKLNTFKVITLIVLLTGGLLVGIELFGNKMLSNEEGIQGERVDTTLSIGQLEWLIQQATNTMVVLKEKIVSDKANPEERFEARKAYREIAINRDTLIKKLKTAKHRQEKIL